MKTQAMPQSEALLPPPRRAASFNVSDAQQARAKRAYEEYQAAIQAAQEAYAAIAAAAGESAWNDAKAALLASSGALIDRGNLTFDGVRGRLLFAGNARIECGSNCCHKNLRGEAV